MTAFLKTKMGVPSILAGIIVNTGLYTVNIMVMGFASNVNLFGVESIFTWGKEVIGGTWYKLILVAIIVVVVAIIIGLFLNTRLGLSIRATGDNPDMVRASSVNTKLMITIGLCVANALTGLSGGLLAQYNKSCDINLGTGMVTIAFPYLKEQWEFAKSKKIPRQKTKFISKRCWSRRTLLRQFQPRERRSSPYQKDFQRSRVIGHLFQDSLRGTAPHMTIEENMALAYLRSSKSKNANKALDNDRILLS